MNEKMMNPNINSNGNENITHREKSNAYFYFTMLRVIFNKTIAFVDMQRETKT